MTTFSWILDSGGAGRGAWQGGVLIEFMEWARANEGLPKVAMGASAGGYAAADVATGVPATVLKGWTKWGLEDIPPRVNELPEFRSLGGLSRFRSHLYHSIRYVMAAQEMAGVFDTSGASRTRLLLFTTRSRRRNGNPFLGKDSRRYFFKSVTRKLPARFKYQPLDYVEDPVVFASHLPAALATEFVRPLTRINYHNAIEASCLVPYAMGEPLKPEELLPIWRGMDPPQTNACADDTVWGKLVSAHRFEGDRGAVFLDGGFALKMPFRIFEQDARFKKLADWSQCDKTIVFCCDPRGRLWETSMRLRALNAQDPVRRALEERRIFIVQPDHAVEAGFLCTENKKIMRTFARGREQAKRVLASSPFQSFLDAQ